MGDLVAWIFDRTRRHRWVWPVVLIALIGLAAVPISRARYSQDLFDALPNEPGMDRYRALLRDLGNGRVVVGFRGEVGTPLDSLSITADRFTAALLSEHPELVDSAFSRPDPAVFENAVQVITDHLPQFADPGELQQLLHMDSAQVDLAIGEVRNSLATFSGEFGIERAMADPFGTTGPLIDRLVASGEMAGVILVNGQLFTSDSAMAVTVLLLKADDARAYDTLKAVIDRAEDPGVTGAAFGAMPMSAANADRIAKDSLWTSLVALALIIALLLWRYRSVRVPLLFVVPPAVGFVLGWGAIASTRTVVSGLSLGASAALLGIAFDYCFHFFTHLRHRRDIAATLREISGPMLLGCTTTVLAFASLSFVGSRTLADLGVIAAFMLTGTALTVLLVLPHFVAIPAAARNGTPPVRQRKANLRWGLALVALITCVLFPFVSRVTYDDDPERMSWIPDDMREVRDRLEGAQDRLVPALLTGSGATEDEARAGLERAAIIARGTAPEARVPLVSTDLFPSEAEAAARRSRWNAVFGGERGERFRRWVEQAEAHHGFTPGAFAPFTDQLGDAPRTGSPDELRAISGEVIAHVDGVVTIAARSLIPPPAIAALEDALAEDRTTGLFHRRMLGERMQRMVSDDLSGILWRTSLIVFLALLITYGRIELALLTFIPMALGWVWILGICGLFGIHFNLVNILVCTFVFGLGDDYCIFTTEGLLARFRTGVDHTRSFRDAVLLSAITTTIGTGVLVFAEHPALRSIAVLSVVGMVALSVISLTLQPALFHLLIGGRATKGKQPFTLTSLFISAFAFLYFLIGCVLLFIFWLALLSIPVTGRWKQRALRRVVRVFTWSLVYVMANTRKDIQGFGDAIKERPAIVIANHASFIDILAMLMISPNVVMMTNRWVWSSPFFGRVVRYAGYLRTEDGAERNVEKARALMAQGISIIIFPEGTRSRDGRIGRFHKGAFHLADALNAPVVPVVLHGFGEAMSKNDALLKNATITMRTLPAILPDDPRFPGDPRQRMKAISAWFKQEYERVRAARETPRWFHERLVRNFTYKGPVLEWHTRIKARMDLPLHELLHARIAAGAEVVDLGAGHGMVSYLLRWCAPGRSVIGLDRDAEKVMTAQHCYGKDDHINFSCVDLAGFTPPPADAYVLKDVLHYLEPEQQRDLLLACAHRLRPGGAIHVRDGFRAPGTRHERTRWTERLSTGIGFNKAKGELHFMGKTELLSIANETGLDVEWALAEARTSNELAILSRRA